MSLEELAPEGFNEGMRSYALMTRPARMYVQGFALSECGVWLDVDGVHTMIGYGEPDSALAEAEAWVERQLSEVRESIVKRNRSMGCA